MELQSPDLTWPQKKQNYNNGVDKHKNPTRRVLFEWVNGTISRTFDKFGYGIAFSEDNASKIWKLRGSWSDDIGGFKPYTGEKFSQGDYVSVQLKHEIYIDKNGQEKENFLVHTYKGDDGNEAWAIKKSDAPAPVSQPTPTQPVQNSGSTVDERIAKGMAFNNMTTLLSSGLIGKHFGDEVEKQWLAETIDVLETAKLGEEIFQDIHPLDDIADSPSVAKAKELGAVEVTDDTVEQETFSWD